ncbi:acetylornithine deacetylase or succinyl-diaminopimelate desuccinylase [Halorubrum aquaticum]|uniref:Probable succinyl-diaminopimelate desuccinylase n=1 Tax=Halorubrum aquaticum TaxID=387340 RepID=A0A1I2Z264_9EURY|nr:ArgE/DapE family deacylase [Halorubrum aquaticum]SFH31639.1 acetylornithine deacetylase or succinyl-diaminopimelate desuccinylase [Halorubrum aquaticum]
MASDAELETIGETVADLEDETVEFLQEMVRTPSVNPPGDYAAIVDLLVAQYEEYGWDVEVERAPAALVEELGLPHPRPNVLAYATRGDGPTIALNAHVDTVPVEESNWTHEPFGGTVEDGRLYGRGARDSKGRIAAYTLAARALEETGLLPEDATLVLALTADEETGGEAGAGHVVESGALEADYAIVEGSTYAVEYASSGVLTLRVDVEGASAHAGLEPEEGANAVVAAARLVERLDAHGDDLAARDSEVPGVGSATCTPSTIEGGDATNVVPPTCSFTVDRRVPPDHDAAAAEREVRDVVADADLPAGTSATVTALSRTKPFLSDPEDPHVRAVAANAERVIGDVPVRGTRGGSDAGHFHAGGTKAVKFGPGGRDSNVHGPDENLALDQLRDAAVVVAASVRDIAGDGV